MRKSWRLLLLLAMVGAMLGGCASGKGAEVRNHAYWMPADVEIPELPDDLETENGRAPELDVYNVETSQIEEMNLEDYVMGVVAGEMKNDWPVEALKAQAILARTFVMQFCDTKESQYDDADISTDVREAQAYAPENINERIRNAVDETRGMVLSNDGEFANAWFFAHAGGKTELPSVALDYAGEDPDYLAVTDSPDSERAPEDVKNWSAEFTFDEIRQACIDVGVEIDDVKNVEVGEKGASGRAKTLIIGGKEISAPTFRIKIGANKLKSTLIDDIAIEQDSVVFTGRGFGHGVGLSQWGAYALAEQGKNAVEIINHYFRNIDIVDMW